MGEYSVWACKWATSVVLRADIWGYPLKEHAVSFGLRLSMENFGRIHDAGIVPLYAAHWLCDDTLVL